MIQIQCRCVSLTPTASSSSSTCSDQNPSCSARSLPLFAKSRSRRVALFSSRLDLARGSGKHHCGNSLLGSCNASLGNDTTGDGDDQFLQAVLLLSETVKHYNLWKQGFIEKTKWHSPGEGHLFSLQRNGEKSNVSSIGLGFLRRFQSPTIFLKIACNGDLLLPIIVGEVAITQLINAVRDDQHKECPDQFQFVKNTVETLGYEVRMVQITERVVNTYFAHIYLGKPSINANISIDARPSDAINVAERFKAPIYVSKEIVSKDAIRIVYGTWRGSGRTIYDVSLDSAAEGPDPLAEEIDLVRKMNTAVSEERYEDAAMWRERLAKFQSPRHEL